MYRTASDVGEESSSFDNTQEEIIQLLREKVSDQQKIIELLEEKVEILAGGNASTNIEAAAG